MGPARSKLYTVPCSNWCRHLNVWTSRRHEIPSQFQQYVCIWSLAFRKKNQKHPWWWFKPRPNLTLNHKKDPSSLWPTVNVFNILRQQRIKLETHPCNPTTYWWYFEGWFGSTTWVTFFSWGPRHLAYKQRQGWKLGLDHNRYNRSYYDPLISDWNWKSVQENGCEFIWGFP